MSLETAYHIKFTGRLIIGRIPLSPGKTKDEHPLSELNLQTAAEAEIGVPLPDEGDILMNHVG